MLRSFAKNFSVGAVVAVSAIVIAWVQLEGRARLDDAAPPTAWLEQAGPNDVLAIPGYTVQYWADPDARYSVRGSKRKKKPVAIVVHYTGVRPVLDLVSYGHRRDFSRGGHAYGYHFYVGRGGRIAQGAPLSKRTNHIKSSRRRQRRPLARHLWSANTIGISLVGGCDPLLRPNWRRWHMCSGEYITNRQLAAGLAVIRALQDRYEMDCNDVYGHGQLQSDRAPFEGAKLVSLARMDCSETVQREGGSS